jgi:hypothetical protein
MLNNITQIPAPRVPVIDAKTGLISREWYRFFVNLFNLTGDGSNTISLTDLQLGPPTDAAVPNTTISEQPILGLELLAQVQSLSNDVAAALLAPPPPEVLHLHYGSFYDTAVQTAAAINTAYPITLNTTSLSYGVDRSTPTSRIVCLNLGVYNFQFSVQATATGAASHYLYIWARINGVDVPSSAGRVEFKGTGNDKIVAWNYVLRMQANDYFELMWSVTDTGITLQTYAATAPAPQSPSIILTVTEVSL